MIVVACRWQMPLVCVCFKNVCNITSYFPHVVNAFCQCEKCAVTVGRSELINTVALRLCWEEEEGRRVFSSLVFVCWFVC